MEQDEKTARRVRAVDAEQDRHRPRARRNENLLDDVVMATDGDDTWVDLLVVGAIAALAWIFGRRDDRTLRQRVADRRREREARRSKG